MRLIVNCFFVAVCLYLMPVNSQTGEEPPFNAQHPADAALWQKEDGSWTFVSFPSGAHLFVFAGDSPGKSNCDDSCAMAWPPLYVSDDSSSESIGNWSIILRENGKKQWAYKDQPVYRRFHNITAGIDETSFSILKP